MLFDNERARSWAKKSLSNAVSFGARLSPKRQFEPETSHCRQTAMPATTETDCIQIGRGAFLYTAYSTLHIHEANRADDEQMQRQCSQWEVAQPQEQRH
jgi:hypothetical protein